MNLGAEKYAQSGFPPHHQSFNPALPPLETSLWLPEEETIVNLVTRNDGFFQDLINRCEPLAEGQRLELSQTPSYSSLDAELGRTARAWLRGNVVDESGEDVAGVEFLFKLPSLSRHRVARAIHRWGPHKNRATAYVSTYF